MPDNQHSIPAVPPLPPAMCAAVPRFVALPAAQQGRDPTREALARLQASRQQTDL